MEEESVEADEKEKMLRESGGSLGHFTNKRAIEGSTLRVGD